jgi:hypothetical protein
MSVLNASSMGRLREARFVIMMNVISVPEERSEDELAAYDYNLPPT